MLPVGFKAQYCSHLTRVPSSMCFMGPLFGHEAETTNVDKLAVHRWDERFLATSTMLKDRKLTMNIVFNIPPPSWSMIVAASCWDKYFFLIRKRKASQSLWETEGAKTILFEQNLQEAAKGSIMEQRYTFKQENYLEHWEYFAIWTALIDQKLSFYLDECSRCRSLTINDLHVCSWQ